MLQYKSQVSKQSSKQVSRQVSGISLKLLKVGETGIVSHLQTADSHITQGLMNLGITTGTTMTLEQRFPHFIVRLDRDYNSCSLRHRAFSQLRQKILLSQQFVEGIYVRFLSSETMDIPQQCCSIPAIH